MVATYVEKVILHSKGRDLVWPHTTTTRAPPRRHDGAGGARRINSAYNGGGVHNGADLNSGGGGSGMDARTDHVSSVGVCPVHPPMPLLKIDPLTHASESYSIVSRLQQRYGSVC